MNEQPTPRMTALKDSFGKNGNTDFECYDKLFEAGCALEIELAECREKNLWLVNQNLKHRTFLNALRISHDLDVPEEVWSELFTEYKETPPQHNHGGETSTKLA